MFASSPYEYAGGSRRDCVEVTVDCSGGRILEKVDVGSGSVCGTD